MPISGKLINISKDVRRKGRVKCAAIGGEQDIPFEQAFANIAHAYLKEKAPGLLDYEIGFQLLDRSDDDEKAVAVFGFKVGNQWLYAPVFFLSGKLKGHELLYIKNQDLFVPLKENWLNYILNRRPSVLGRTVDRNTRLLGVMPPHLYQLSRSPNKFASAEDSGDLRIARALGNMPEWARDITPTVAHWATVNPTKDPKYASLVDLPTFLRKEGAAVIRALVNGFEANPKLAGLVNQLHGLSIIDDAIAEVKKRAADAASNSVLKEAKHLPPAHIRRVKRKPVETSVVTNTEPGDLLKGADEYSHLTSAAPAGEHRPLLLYTYDEVLHGGSGQYNLTGQEREKLVKDRVVIRDNRSEASVAYEMQTPVRLFTPGETGIYDLLVKDNRFEKCLVLYQPYDEKRRNDFVTVVRLAGENAGKAWMNIHPAHLFVAQQYPQKDYRDWVETLPTADSLPVSRRGLHILINNSGQGSTPFKVEREVMSSDRHIYDVYFLNYSERGRPGHLPPLRHGGEGREYYDRPLWSGDGGCRIVLTGKRGASMRATGSDLYVPGDYRLLTLRSTEENDDDLDLCGCNAHSDPPPIQPGSQLDIDLLIGTKVAEVKISSNGTEFDVNGVRASPLSALIHLVRDHGLREKQARTLLKRATVEKVARFRILYASGFNEKRAQQEYELQRSAPSSPAFPEPYYGYDPLTGGEYPTMQKTEFNIKLPELSAANTDRMIYHPRGPEPDYQQPMPDRESQMLAMQAGQMGQREVFDTSMIAGLLKAVRDDSMVDRHIPDLMKALDRLGRILFVYYWHGDRFEERFGKSEMVELEDGLRNTFEGLGDLVLFLKQRSIEPNPDEIRDVSLAEVAG